MFIIGVTVGAAGGGLNYTHLKAFQYFYYSYVLCHPLTSNTCMSVFCEEELRCASFPADETGNLDDLNCIATSQESEQWKTKLIMPGLFMLQQLLHALFPHFIT